MHRRAFLAALGGCLPETEEPLMRHGLVQGDAVYATPASVVIGDSLSRGAELTSPTTENWFARFMADPRLAGKATPTNSGIDSNTAAQMLARVGTDVDPYFVPGARWVPSSPIGSVCFVFGGTNSAFFGVSEPTYRADQIAICDGRQALGFYVVFLTMTPRDGGAPPTFATSRADNNAFWLSPSGLDHANLVVDIGNLPHAANPLDSTYYYQPAAVHYKANLAQEIGTAVADAFCAQLGI